MNDPSVRLEIERLKSNSGTLPVHPFPHPPELANNGTPIRTRLKLIQAYITSLEYNYTGEEFFVKKQDRGFRHVSSTAKLIIREALPIQCVDAVFLGAYLTSEMAEVDRFPVCFRSSLDGRVFRHIVLAVRSHGVWGALGLSRRDTLMYKELRYPSFAELMADFRTSYAGSWHRLEQLWVGFPLPHDISSNVPVKWKVMRASVGTDSEWGSAAPDLDRFVSCASSLYERFQANGKISDHPLLRNSAALSDEIPPGGDAKNTKNNGNTKTGVDGKPTTGTAGGTCSSPMHGVGRDGGERSPGAPCCWLLPGGRRRRASMPVAGGGKATAVTIAAAVAAAAAFEENDGAAAPKGIYRAAQGTTNGGNGRVDCSKVSESVGAGGRRGGGRVRRGKGDGGSGSSSARRGSSAAVSTGVANSGSGAFAVNSPPRPRRARCATAGVSKRLYFEKARAKPTAAGSSVDNADSASEGCLVKASNTGSAGVVQAGSSSVAGMPAIADSVGCEK